MTTHRDGVLVEGVGVEVPLETVVAVRQAVPGHPVLLVAATFRHDARYQPRRPDVEL